MKNSINQLVHRYTYDLRLKIKFIIFHIILILLPTTVPSGFFFLRVYGIVMEDNIRPEQVLSPQTVNFTENLMSHVAPSSDTITNPLSVQDIFRIPTDIVGNRTITTSRTNSLFHLAQNIMDTSLITDVKIYYDDKAYNDLMQYNRVGSTLFIPTSSIPSSYWYGIYSSSDRIHLLCPEPYLTPDKAEEDGKLVYITRIPYTNADQIPVGPNTTSVYVAVYLSRSAFGDVLRKDAMVKDEAALVINERDAIVSASDMSLTGMYFVPQSQLSTCMGMEKKFSLVSFLDSTVYTAYLSINDADWTTVSIIPVFHIIDAGRGAMTHFVIVYLLFTVATMYISFQLSNSIVDRITAVALQMERVHSGCPQPMDIEDTDCDEMGVLVDTYNHMIEEIGLLMDSQKQATDDLRRAEFRTLQAQINPHSLHNILDMINWLSQTGRSEEVTQAIQALSRSYELTLSRKSLMNSIETGLQHVSLYVKFQNVRYDDCVTFMIDIPEELYEYTIPKLTSQPIVENAFFHGIMTTEEKKGSTLLTGRRPGDDIEFIISDDGAGIPPEKLDTLMYDADHTDTDSGVKQPVIPGHIGIYNTNLRLRSLYGESYGLLSTSTLGKGTEMTSKIPTRRITDSLERIQTRRLDAGFPTGCRFPKKYGLPKGMQAPS